MTTPGKTESAPHCGKTLPNLSNNIEAKQHAASGPPPVWGRGHDGAVGRAGQPVHARLRVGVHMADERREPEDGQRLPARRVEDGRRHRPPGRGPPQGRDALAVRRPGGDRRGYRKGHTYPTVVRRTDPKGQLYRSWRLEEPLRLLGLSLDRAGGELNRWVFRASHSRIPEIVELPKKIRRRRPDIPRTIEPGCSNARLEAFDNRIKATIRMAYGFHRVTNLIALIMLRCSGFDIRLPQPTI